MFLALNTLTSIQILNPFSIFDDINTFSISFAFEINGLFTVIHTISPMSQEFHLPRKM